MLLAGIVSSQEVIPSHYVSIELLTRLDAKGGAAAIGLILYLSRSVDEENSWSRELVPFCTRLLLRTPKQKTLRGRRRPQRVPPG